MHVCVMSVSCVCVCVCVSCAEQADQYAQYMLYKTAQHLQKEVQLVFFSDLSSEERNWSVRSGRVNIHDKELACDV